MKSTKEKFRKYLKWFIKGYLRNLYWEIYGRSINNPSLPAIPKSFLFVCKGNICRSVFAEHIALKIVNDNLKKTRSFYSVGLHVNNPIHPPEGAVLAGKRFSVDLDDHRSRKISQDLIETYDMVLSMEAWQLKVLKADYPYLRHKFFLLPLFDDYSRTSMGYKHYNILDPYGKSSDIYDDCFKRIERCVTKLISSISF